MKIDQPTRWVALPLRWGAYGSAIVLAVGLSWLMLEPDVPLQIGSPMPLSALLGQLGVGNPYAVIQVAILMLLVTSPLSILLGTIAFTRTGERLCAIFGALLLLALIFTLFALGR